MNQRKIFDSIKLSYFPLKDGMKIPNVSQGFKSPKIEIETKLSENPNCNLGITCGSVSGNLCVLDFEVETDAWMFLNKTILENTLCVKTCHNGIHIYLRTLDDCPRRQTKVCGKVHPFDLCGEGGYVVAPGSIINHALCDLSKENCPHAGRSMYHIVSKTNEILLVKELQKSIWKKIVDLGWSTQRDDSQLVQSIDNQHLFDALIQFDKEFADLYNGIWENKGIASRSEAEFRICYKLVKAGFENTEIYEIMNRCKIGKWQEKEDSYCTRTISRARTLVKTSYLKNSFQKTTVGS